MKNAIIIFVRNPELGKVKTRLAKEIGDEKALLVYKKLLQHTHDITCHLDCHKYVFYVDAIQEKDLWEHQYFNKKVQAATGLGARMQQAFDSLFAEGYDKVLIIGSDCPGLTSNHIKTAFKLLDETDVVIGPAEDGGYYLLGLQQPFAEIFLGKNWSTASVLPDTITDIKAAAKRYFLLETLSDVDEVSDLKRYPHLIDF